MSLSEWLIHLETLNKESISSSISKEEKCAPVIDIAKSLGLLPVQIPVITIAGTNGKGSCVALLSSILTAAGYQVGTFTSPHLIDYKERIQINQTLVAESILLQAFEAVERARKEQVLGYFAFTFLVSLWVFHRLNIDIMVLEVGIGGRYDIVNVVDATIAVVTSIALDHTEILGDNLTAIALEKAGIMRSHKPCVWGATNTYEEAEQYAKALNAQFLRYGQDFSVEKMQSDASTPATLTFTSGSKRLQGLPIPNITYLPNAACALQAIQLLPSHLSVNEQAIHTGLSKTFVPGRFQIIPGEVTTILDVAHNPASAQLLAENLQQHYSKRILIVGAISQAKDIHGILAPLSRLADAWYLGEFELERGVPATTLANCLETLSITQYNVFYSVSQAYQAALQAAQPSDTVVVMGSFHTVGAIMELRRDKK